MSEQSASFDSKRFLKDCSSLPGVYRMYNDSKEIIYVGKAKDLKKRLSSYFRKTGLSIKTQSLVAQIDNVETTITHTEGEALLLESNLIKEFRPRYNVLLRDDKSYPFLFLSTEDNYPMLRLHRGAKRKKGRYFGPYPNAGAVRETLNLIQKVFRIRQCDESYFRNRSRPCLQYQIRRCTAPCVERISQQDYAVDIDHVTRFLEGKSQTVVQDLVRQMEQASATQHYEKAAELRDQISHLQAVIERQYVSGYVGDVDVIACATDAGLACVEIYFIRNGQSLGSKSFFPKLPQSMQRADVLNAFLPQYYLNNTIPSEIVLSDSLEDETLIEDVLTEKRGRKVSLSSSVRSDKSRWLEYANKNAEKALMTRINSAAGMLKRFDALQTLLHLDHIPTRLECFDISHTMGEATVASCVVFSPEGPLKSDYRRFNIEGIEPGDDYAAMKQALKRRYARIRKNEGKKPDILFIDGGKGQLSQAIEVMNELQIDDVLLIGVAKGEGRKAGLEKLVMTDGTELYPGQQSIALNLVLHVRDEAHRFAISGHRAKRQKARTTSQLEQIPGLGAKRRQSILKHFGGIQAVSKAGVEDLAKTPGISKNLAQLIYDSFHTD
ncbi:MAG: excinuclease ABC subunit UvrC [Gammaproteobacteria bacterium]|nr:excinuclease ABC subunit UvrC [Gammaproteobacteria bacterium]